MGRSTRRSGARAVWSGAVSMTLAGAGSVAAHPGHGLVVDSTGRIHFVDLVNETIWTIDTDGTLRATEVAKHMHTLSIDGADRLYFEDVRFVGSPVMVGEPPRREEAGTRTCSIWRLDPVGQLAAVVPPTATPYATATQRLVDDFGNGLTTLVDERGTSYGLVYDAGIDFPRLVARTPLAPDGRTIVIAARVHETRDGVTHPPDLAVVQAMAWGRDGSILLTENGTVWRLSRDGRLAPVGGRPLVRAPTMTVGLVWQDSVLGVAEDAEGNVYAADYGRSSVRRIAPDGRVTTVRRAPRGWSPTGVAIDGADVLVLENRVGLVAPISGLLCRGGLGGPRVVRIAPDGRVTVLATVNGHRVSAFYTGLGVGLLGVAVVVVLIVRRRRARPPQRPAWPPRAELTSAAGGRR